MFLFNSIWEPQLKITICILIIKFQPAVSIVSKLVILDFSETLNIQITKKDTGH